MTRPPDDRLASSARRPCPAGRQLLGARSRVETASKAGRSTAGRQLITRRVCRRSVVLPATFVLVSAALAVILGVPDRRDVIGLWLIGGLLVLWASGVPDRARTVLRELVPVLGLLLAYDALRGDAKDLLPTHYLPQIRVDEALFGSDPTVTLQHALWHGLPRWYDLVLAVVYLTHFIAAPLLAAALWKIDRARYRGFVTTIATLSALGLLTYALYPAAPPWLASHSGFLPHVTRIVPAVWQGLDVRFLGSLIDSGYRYANNVAAVPSLHTAYAVVVAAFLWPRQRRWPRPLVAAYPVLMSFALVYTGEHYVFDILLGWLYAAAAIVLVRTFARRRASRAQAAVAV